MLSKVRGVVDPDAFVALVEIFETAWAEVSHSGEIADPDVPTARSELATLVMEQMDRPDLSDMENVRTEIVAVFWGRRSPA
jgi:hypothetical protein